MTMIAPCFGIIKRRKKECKLLIFQSTHQSLSECTLTEMQKGHFHFKNYILRAGELNHPFLMKSQTKMAFDANAMGLKPIIIKTGHFA